jgi:hypothetical protein
VLFWELRNGFGLLANPYTVPAMAQRGNRATRTSFEGVTMYKGGKPKKGGSKDQTDG